MLSIMVMGAAIVSATPRSAIAALSRQSEPVDDLELRRWLTTQMGDADVSSLVTAWLRTHPEDRDRSAVERRIIAMRKKGEALDQSLARVIAFEHAAGKGEWVDGWMLAPTEARLLVLLNRPDRT
jgi:hypothetical protein